jgi:hypothetical protein
MMQRPVMIALALGTAFGLGSASASMQPTTFNGTWKVRLVTESGTCDSSYNQTIAIENGRVRPLAVESGTAISGGVGNNGNVAITIHRSIAKADASGQLNARSGSGTWKLAMLGCTGRWTAYRA